MNFASCRLPQLTTSGPSRKLALGLPRILGFGPSRKFTAGAPLAQKGGFPLALATGSKTPGISTLLQRFIRKLI
jgi:hypothetical protein